MRIVSLCPSITETLIEFGLAESLVGITRFCIHPAEAVRAIERVGGTKDPNLERISALAPDLVFLNEEENRREDYQALADQFPVDVSHPRTVREVPALLRHIGARVEQPAIAERWAGQIEAELTALEAEPAPRPFTYLYVIWRKPWMSINGDTYISDLLTLAGGENVFETHAERYPSFEPHLLGAAVPDRVLLPDEPFPFRASHADELRVDLPHSQYVLLSGDDVCWHGVRTWRGIRLARSLRGCPQKADTLSLK